MWHGESYQGWCPEHGTEHMENGYCLKCEAEQEEEKMSTDCKQCKGWGNSCSPDWYPDYVTDPKNCEYFEPIQEEEEEEEDGQTEDV